MSKSQLVERRVTYTLEHDGKFYVVEDVPARVDEESARDRDLKGLFLRIPWRGVLWQRERQQPMRRRAQVDVNPCFLARAHVELDAVDRRRRVDGLALKIEGLVPR